MPAIKLLTDKISLSDFEAILPIIFILPTLCIVFNAVIWIFDSLAEAFEKNGQFKQSAENYEKAYKMAQAGGDAQLAQTAKENFERVSEKLK